jgi:cytochrome c-type biogenesis protein
VIADPGALRRAVESAHFASAGVAFAAGLLFSFNPVAIAAIPVALAYVTHARKPREAIRLGFMFVLGMILTHVALGVAAGLGGRWVESLMGRGWGLMLGPLLILLGFIWAGWIRVPLPSVALKAKRPAGAWGAFVLGIPFTVAICPVCTPALLALLGVVGAVGSPVLGGLVLLAFALGRAVPLLLGASAIGWVEGLRAFSGLRRAFDVSAGIALVASGLYLLNAYYFVIPSLAG